MQIMVDTNVVLDVLLNRTAHVNESAAVLKAASDDIQEFISASAITDIYYIAQKELKKPSLTKQLIRNLLQIVHVSSVSEVDIWAALDSGWEDFEDAVQNFSAVADPQITAIITRNIKDFKNSSLEVVDSVEFLNSL